jgi:hypothetical protein
LFSNSIYIFSFSSIYIFSFSFMPFDHFGLDFESELWILGVLDIGIWFGFWTLRFFYFSLGLFCLCSVILIYWYGSIQIWLFFHVLLCICHYSLIVIIRIADVVILNWITVQSTKWMNNFLYSWNPRLLCLEIYYVHFLLLERYCG